MPFLIRTAPALALAAALAGCAPSTALDDGAVVKGPPEGDGGELKTGPCNGVVPQMCPYEYELK